ncbi:DUF3108 domain-containing protein [Anaeromyxobacter terrae]|uniref:DUF3108 domain-containing protein n=1 Tax=Anaeromyxobacter terrae TaxID=2925406 RepID=UPI001F5A87E9|nr:DUF3108 domain-containing protein [Anaeromyxobacter sp. SG22]
MLAPLLALVLAAGSQCALPPIADGERPWRTGETLDLELDVLGAVKAGTLQLTVERPMSGGRIVPLRGRARTTAAVASIRRFAGVGLSWIDARTLLPERYRDDTDENGVRRSSDARIPADGRVTIAYRHGDRASEASFDPEGEVLDALSALYYLRAARLAPGDRFCFDAIASRRLWHLEGSVAAEREPVETPAGRFQTFRVDALARRADRPDARPRPVHLWFTRDSRRLLVAAVSEIELGPVRAQLVSVRGARER